MRISLISSPNSKEEFFYFLFIMFKIFIFLCLLWWEVGWGEEHLAGGARVQLVCALVERLKGPPQPLHPHCPSLPPELNSFGPLSPFHATWNAGLVVGRSAKAATNNNLFIRGNQTIPPPKFQNPKQSRNTYLKHNSYPSKMKKVFIRVWVGSTIVILQRWRKYSSKCEN